MMLSPRQIAAYLELSERIDRIERASNLMITAIGAQGDNKAIEKLFKELNGPQVQSQSRAGPLA